MNGMFVGSAARSVVDWGGSNRGLFGGEDVVRELDRAVGASAAGVGRRRRAYVGRMRGCCPDLCKLAVDVIPEQKQ